MQRSSLVAQPGGNEKSESRPQVLLRVRIDVR